MNRRILIRITTSFAIIGLAFALVPLIRSLGPSAKADVSLSRIDVSQLKLGQLELHDHPLNGDLYGGYSWSVLLLRHEGGKVSAWDVPTIDGKVGMPDIHWWRPFYTCKKFELTTLSHGGNVHFACSDSEIPSDYWRAEWQWDEFGKALGMSVDDMQVTVGSLEGNYFVFGKRS